MMPIVIWRQNVTEKNPNVHACAYVLADIGTCHETQSQSNGVYTRTRNIHAYIRTCFARAKNSKPN